MCRPSVVHVDIPFREQKNKQTEIPTSRTFWLEGPHFEIHAQILCKKERLNMTRTEQCCGRSAVDRPTQRAQELVRISSNAVQVDEAHALHHHPTRSSFTTLKHSVAISAHVLTDLQTNSNGARCIFYFYYFFYIGGFNNGIMRSDWDTVCQQWDCMATTQRNLRFPN